MEFDIKVTVLLAFALLTACSKHEAVKLDASKQTYIGAWQQLYENRSPTDYTLHNVLLIISPDSSVLYRRCFASLKKENEDSKTFKSKSYRSTSFPNARLTGITGNNLHLEQDAWLFTLPHDIPVEGQPYKQADKWYFKVDDARLVKLTNNEIKRYTSWQCPEKEEIFKGKN